MFQKTYKNVFLKHNCLDNSVRKSLKINNLIMFIIKQKNY